MCINRVSQNIKCAESACCERASTFLPVILWRVKIVSYKHLKNSDDSQLDLRL